MALVSSETADESFEVHLIQADQLRLHLSSLLILHGNDLHQIKAGRIQCLIKLRLNLDSADKQELVIPLLFFPRKHLLIYLIVLELYIQLQRLNA